MKLSQNHHKTRLIQRSSSDPDSDYVEKVPTLKKRKRGSTKSTTPRSNNKSEVKTRTSGDTWRHPVSQHTISDPIPLRDALLQWYSGVHENRGMPWRKPYNPNLTMEERSQRAYEVWISEIMLQQTQVATVIGYYNRWMERFPTIQDLAAADIETVNGLWKGLGYYSRAARLLSGAQKIVKEYDGIFPLSAKSMRDNIPGIGRYSSGAISSIAYNDCEPVLDGNVTRLLCRLFALGISPKSKKALDILWSGAEVMVNKSSHPGDINQALIELGATVCKARNPTCDTCPLRQHCAAYREVYGKGPLTPRDSEQDIEELCQLCEPPDDDEATEGVTRYPVKVEKKKAREELDIVCVIEWRSLDGERWFVLSKRPDTGLLAGLHEFPTRENVDVKSSNLDTLQTNAYEVLGNVFVHPPIRPFNRAKKASSNSSKDNDATPEDSTRINVEKVKFAGDVLHIFSHIRKTYRIQWVLLGGGDGSDPPALRQKRLDISVGTSKVDDDDDIVEVEGPKSKKAKVVKGKETKKVKKKPGAETSKKDGEIALLRWVRYDDIEKANIGTGVLKVWKKVNELWTDGTL